MVRGTFYFDGYVQGVGFRYNTFSMAQRYKVGGFVRNLPDGRVELVVEGEKEEVLKFIAELKNSMRDFVRDVKETWSDPLHEFNNFEVRF